MGFNVPEIVPQPIPGFRIQPAADVTTFGGGPGLAAEGQEVQKIALETGDIGAFERIKANKTAVENASANALQVYNDAHAQFMQTRGVDALHSQDVVEGDVKKQINKISEGLSDPDQQGAFNKEALQYYELFHKQVVAHTAQQMDQHYTDQFQHSITNLSGMAATTVGDDKGFNQTVLPNAVNKAKDYALSMQFDSDKTDQLVQDTKDKIYEARVKGLLKFGKPGAGQSFYSDHNDDMSEASKARAEQLLDVIPRQQEEAAKKQEAEFYKSNERQTTLDFLDNKLTLSELQRRYRDNQINQSTYDHFENALSKPDAGAMRSFETSEPKAFNQIRQAQLIGSKDPGEIQRMVTRGVLAKEINPDDAKYLLSISGQKPPTPRDKEVQAAADNLKDFGNRYFAETNFFGHPTNQDKTNKESEALVSDFYASVDKTRAQGEDITKIRDQVLKTAMQKRFPGLGNLEKAPDVVIDVQGKVIRVLNPDQHSGLKPKFKITHVGTESKEES